MKTINDVAAAAYHAHAKELCRLVGVNARPWVELPRTEMLCWEASIRQVLAEVAAMGCAIGLAVPGMDLTSIKPAKVQP